MTFRKELNEDSPAEELPVEIPEKNILSENISRVRNELLPDNLITDANRRKSKYTFRHSKVYFICCS